MDETDKRIIEILKKDASATNSKIGKSVGLSEGAVRKRIMDMRENGTISRFTVEVRGPAAAVRAVVFVQIEKHADNKTVCKKVAPMPGIERVWEITGDSDVCVLASAMTMDELNSAIDSIRETEGVAGTQTHIITKEWA
ncbi:MAG: Lrp/AsnC family transcriptional regulator [Candidatus Micrarchaeia archaeon]